MNKIEQIKERIRNMSMEEFCARVNRLARATRYCTDNDNVCEVLDTKSSIKVVHLDPEYLGIHSSTLCINDFKKICIQMIIDDWTWATNEEKITILKTFLTI